MRRKAFTLVELLVVIAIIGVLVSLLLPAVQAAREAARRSQCQNNLRQTGIALHNYHDVFKFFPAGWIDTAPALTREYEGWGWAALMLPYIEQKPLYDALGVGKSNLHEWIEPGGAYDGGPGYRQNVETRLTIFMCPSDTGYNGAGQVHNNRDFNAGFGIGAAGWAQPVLPGVSNYVGNFGHRFFTSGQSGTIYEQNTGMFWRNSRVNSASLIDGLSQTVAVGERESRNCRSASWVGVQDSQGDDQFGAYLVGGGSLPKLNQDDNVFAWNHSNRRGCGEGFSSLHPNGAQFCFADGSVHFIADSIAHNWVGNVIDQNEDQRNGLYQRLLSRNDELPLLGEW